MRISLLEKRENFYKILHDTLRSNNFPNNKFSSRRYVVNKYLNFALLRIDMYIDLFFPSVTKIWSYLFKER